MTVSLAVILLTKDEEIHLARALDSVKPFAQSMHVIDSGSTDRTVEIAEAFGAEVLVHPFKNHADQFQWGIENVTTDADWIMKLDADEIIEADLAARISSELPSLSTSIVGINLDRKHIFLDRWVKHGGRYPLTMLRIFRRGHGRVEQRWMDEHVVIDGGEMTHFAGGFADHNLNDLSFFTDKHNKYATSEALDVLTQKYLLVEGAETFQGGSVSRQAGFKRWVKEKIYNRIPFPISSFGYFVFRYVFQLGFLDGREGLIYHFLQGYWYRFLVGAKILELERVLKPAKGREEMIDLLEKATGRRIRP